MHNNSIIKGDNYEHLHAPLLPVCLLNFCIIATSHSAWYSCFVCLSCRHPLTQQLPSNVATHHLTKPTKTTQQLPSSSPSTHSPSHLHGQHLPLSWHCRAFFIIRLSSFLLLASDRKWWTKSDMQSIKEETLKTIVCEKKIQSFTWAAMEVYFSISFGKYEMVFIDCTLGKCRWQNIYSTNVFAT